MKQNVASHTHTQTLTHFFSKVGPFELRSFKNACKLKGWSRTCWYSLPLSIIINTKLKGEEEKKEKKNGQKSFIYIS